VKVNVLLILLCLFFPCFAQAQAAIDTENKQEQELPSLTPNNQHSFDNFIKAIKQLETESFLTGKSIFSIKTVTPRDVIQDYKKDPNAADKIYKGRPIRIKATVVSINKNAFNRFYIETHGNNPKERVNIYFNPADGRYVQYKSGSQIDLVCYGQGINIAFPSFDQCVFSTDYISKEYGLIEQHIAQATQKNYEPISKKELSTIVLYKTIEPVIEEACKKSIKECLNQTLTQLQTEPDAGAVAKYAPVNEKYAHLPNLPPKEESL